MDEMMKLLKSAFIAGWTFNPANSGKRLVDEVVDIERAWAEFQPRLAEKLSEGSK